MSGIGALILMNLEKVGIGAGLFLGAYLANIVLGIWKNVKIDGYEFDKNLIIRSLVKFIALGVGLALLTVVISIVPTYITFVGVAIEPEALAVLDNLVIVGMFLTTTIRYAKDAIDKLSVILGNS